MRQLANLGSGMRVKVKLKELKGATADYISLVARGANRLPFRIVKADQENQMIDITSFGSVLKREKAQKEAAANAPKPVITALGVMKGSDEEFAAVKKAVGDSGFDITKESLNDDGSVTFVQKEDALEGDMVKISDNLAAVVLNFTGTDVAAAQAAFPTVYKADAAITEALGKIKKAPSDLGDKSGTGTTGSETGGASATALAGMAHPDVVGAEGAKGGSPQEQQPKVDMTLPKDPPKGFNRGVWEGMRDLEKLEVLNWSKASKADSDNDGDSDVPGCPKGISQEAWDAMTPQERKSHMSDNASTPVDKKETAVKEEPKVDIAGEIAKALAPLNESMTKLASDLRVIGEQVTAAKSEAEAATKAVKGTVAAAPGGGDAPGVDTKKVAADGYTGPLKGCFDTAMISKKERYSRP